MMCISFYFVDFLVKTIIYLSKIRIQQWLLKKFGDKKGVKKKDFFVCEIKKFGKKR